MNNQKPKSRMQYGLKRTAATCCGNTLVPVIIALAISMAASVTFLQQGTVLNEKTLMLEAPNELIRLTKKFKDEIKTYKDASIVSTTATFSPNLGFNVFGNSVRSRENSTSSGNYELLYVTKTPSQCQELAALLAKHPDVSRVCCGCSDTTHITIFQY